MNLYVKINSIKYSIISYSYRLNNVDLDTKISHLFSCVVVSDNAVISVSDTIELYSDDVLIYSDPINSVIQNGTKFNIRSEKTVNIPASKENIIPALLYYSSTTLRVPLDFDIMPLDTLTTPSGTFTASTVINYNIYTEVTIGQS